MYIDEEVINITYYIYNSRNCKKLEEIIGELRFYS